MSHVCDANCEHRARLDAAVAQLQASTAFLAKSVFSGSDESIESAYSALRVAKVKFSSAWELYRESRPLCQTEL